MTAATKSPAWAADRTLTPGGVLRVAINLGNPLLARLDSEQRPCGVSVDLAQGVAYRLGVALQLTVYDGAAKAVQSVAEEHNDVGFFAVDPLRAQGVQFTPPYLLIEGCYAVRDASPLRSVEEVDAADRRIVVGRGSAYDLYLTREIRHARLERADSSPAVVATFLETGADVAAGVRQQLEADAARLGGLRLLDGRFMLIQQAMGCPRARGGRALEVLANYLRDVRTNGALQAALQRHGIEGVSTAPDAAAA
jgi:polar amino acid transport system substrate-binding protein